jgi:hypothetical protein
LVLGTDKELRISCGRFQVSRVSYASCSEPRRVGAIPVPVRDTSILFPAYVQAHAISTCAQTVPAIVLAARGVEGAFNAQGVSSRVNPRHGNVKQLPWVGQSCSRHRLHQCSQPVCPLGACGGLLPVLRACICAMLRACKRARAWYRCVFVWVCGVHIMCIFAFATPSQRKFRASMPQECKAAHIRCQCQHTTAESEGE